MPRNLLISDTDPTEIEGLAYGGSLSAGLAVSRLQTWEQLDAQSDEHFEQALRGLVALARRHPALVADVAPLVAELHRGIQSDATEDELCLTARASASDARDQTRAIAGVCESHLTRCEEGRHAA